jgi:hypothetical protein
MTYHYTDKLTYKDYVDDCDSFLVLAYDGWEVPKYRQ